MKITKPKLVFAGYFGSGNIGDEAILLTQISLLKKNFDMAVLSANPENTAKTFKVKSASLPTAKKVLQIDSFFKTISWCDGLVLGGGGFFANKLQSLSTYYWLLLMLTARIFRKKIILFSMGCGPFRNGLIWKPIQSMLNNAELILLRDQVSLKFVNQIGGTKVPTKVTADIVFLLKKDMAYVKTSIFKVTDFPAPRVLFVLCPRFQEHRLWRHCNCEEKYLLYTEAMAKLADFVVDTLKGTSIFLPFFKDDVAFYKDILRFMKNKNNAVVLEYGQEIGDILSLFSKVDLVVGARYHSIIFSMITGVPVLPIIYHPKTFELAKRANLSSLEIGAGIEWRDIDINLTKGKELLLDLWENKPKYVSSLVSQTEVLKVQAMKNISNLKKIFQLEEG
jgi:polysaccharide pyruvyl transferase CsaB